jgi:hypothetical protein
VYSPGISCDVLSWALAGLVHCLECETETENDLKRTPGEADQSQHPSTVSLGKGKCDHPMGKSHEGARQEIPTV